MAYTFVSPYKRHRISRLTTRSCPHSAPASIPLERSNISTTDTPVLLRPSMIVCCRGAAPRYSGSREGCTLRRLLGRKSSRIRLGKICPKDAVTIKCEAGGGTPGSANGEGGCGQRSAQEDYFGNLRTCHDFSTFPFPGGMKCTGTWSCSPSTFRGATHG